MMIIQKDDFGHLFQILKSSGFKIIGPTVCDQAIVYDHIESIAQLPEGWTDDQSPGKYRLAKRKDKALFGYVVGPTSWKKFLYPPIQKLFGVKKNNGSLNIDEAPQDTQKTAFIGVRSCELAAIKIQDKIFMKGSFVDPHYQARRNNAFIIAVNCTEPGGTCFCTSMQTGPKATSGFDIALTEITGETEHYFLAESGTEEGRMILDQIPHEGAGQKEKENEKYLLDRASRSMGRSMDITNIKELLYQNPEHPQWEKVAERCLACANCTMSCPTCFCSTVEDVTDLTGRHAERWRKWDSCFTMDFTYIHGGHHRSSGKSRYRQWMTHKLASWQDQFGSSGCVGCGRCITWCPVGIDITEEVRAIRENQPAVSTQDKGGQ